MAPKCDIVVKKLIRTGRAQSGWWINARASHFFWDYSITYLSVTPIPNDIPVFFVSSHTCCSLRHLDFIHFWKYDPSVNFRVELYCLWIELQLWGILQDSPLWTSLNFGCPREHFHILCEFKRGMVQYCNYKRLHPTDGWDFNNKVDSFVMLHHVGWSYFLLSSTLSILKACLPICTMYHIMSHKMFYTMYTCRWKKCYNNNY